MDTDLFVKEYLIAALWADLLEENKGYTIDNIAASSIDKARKDCEKFTTNNAADIDRATKQTSLAHVAHDFWLTRNHHGAGFWDGDYTKKLGERLTKQAHKFNELSVYIGDDGLVYVE